jgi:uncharacterized protein YndB with AHSA1/START domain
MTVDLELKLTRHIPALPERVYQAWLDPAVMVRFFHGHPDHSVTSADTDPRLGGSYRVVMNDGTKDIPHWGEYRRLDRPTCIEFTWNSPHATPDSIVTLTFTPSETGTEVTLVHDRFPSEGARDGHEKGWGCILDQLAKALQQG